MTPRPLLRLPRQDRYLEVLTKAKKKRVRNLTPAQGFLIGSLAKVVATLVTYPLICAKVTQQSRTARAARAARSGDGDGGSVGTVTEILQEVRHVPSHSPGCLGATATAPTPASPAGRCVCVCVCVGRFCASRGRRAGIAAARHRLGPR